MFKFISNPWLERVEAIEEQLEQVKFSWKPTSVKAFKKSSVVRKTAGLLGKKFPAGLLYERHIRNEWEQASRKRVA